MTTVIVSDTEFEIEVPGDVRGSESGDSDYKNSKYNRYIYQDTRFPNWTGLVVCRKSRFSQHSTIVMNVLQKTYRDLLKD